MASVVNVEIVLKVRDGTAGGLQNASKAAQKAAETVATATEKSAEKAATATEKAARRAAEAAEKGAARQRSSAERLSRERETLGTRSEQAIQREIQRTEAAYQRLLRLGTLSFQQQAAAADQMRHKVNQLTNEIGKLTRAQKDHAGLRFGISGAVGAAAAAYTLKGPAMPDEHRQPVQRPVNSRVVGKMAALIRGWHALPRSSGVHG